MPKFDVRGPLPFDQELTRDYPLVPAPTPLEALLADHRDALGSRRVKLRNGQIIFSHSDDLALAVGRWKITRVGWNAEGGVAELLDLAARARQQYIHSKPAGNTRPRAESGS